MTAVQFDLSLPEPVAVPGDARAPTGTVVRSARRRSLAIHVSPLGELEVRAPLWASAGDIARFVDRHRDWIARKLSEATANPPWVPRYAAGGEWFWQGEALTLASGGPRGARLEQAVLALPLPPDAAPARWQSAVFAWHRREAAALLEPRAAALFARHCEPHRLHRVEWRWMRATWGTCSCRKAADGRRDIVLRLNPWLAALPPSLSDAILLHELAHVEHMHHGAAFYRRLSRLDPDWQAHDRQLRDWGRRLLPVAGR